MEAIDRRLAQSPDGRRLTELARAAGLGDSPDDVLTWNQESLTRLGNGTETRLTADALRWQGSVLRDRGRTSEAEPVYHRSLNLATRIGYDAGAAHALNCLASLAQRRGDMLGATQLLADSLELAERCGERRLVGMVQHNLGILADIRGNPAAALAHYQVSRASFEESNDRGALAWLLNNLGVLYVKERQDDDAAESFRQALCASRAQGDLLCEGVVQENIAELHLIRGAVQEAFAPLSRALEIAEQRGDDVRRAAALKLRGAYQRLVDRPDEAVDTLRYALTLSAVAEDALLGAEVLYQFGLALYAAGQEASARDAWAAALDAFERIAATQWIARVHKRLRTGVTGRYF